MNDNCITNTSDSVDQTQNSPAQAAPDLRWQHGADESFIKGIAAGNSVARAARLAGISERTGFRRMQDPQVLQQISEMRSTLMDVAVDRLCHAADPASQTLYSLLQAPSDSVKLSAARAILEKSVTVRNYQELDSRMAEVEAIRTEEPSQSIAQAYWPDTLQEWPPEVHGFERRDALRHEANWLEYILRKGGLTDEVVKMATDRIEALRDTARKLDRLLDPDPPTPTLTPGPAPDLTPTMRIDADQFPTKS